MHFKHDDPPMKMGWREILVVGKYDYLFCQVLIANMLAITALVKLMLLLLSLNLKKLNCQSQKD